MSELYDIKELQEGKFPLSFILIECYHREDPMLMKNLILKNALRVLFCGGLNTINLVTFNDKIVIPLFLQRYAVKWYHMHLLHTGLDRTEAIINQHSYWTSIKNTVRKQSHKV